MERNLKLEELIQGYAQNDEACTCVLCGESFEKGRIYEIDGALYDAWGAVRRHITEQHGNTADFLLGREPKKIGISEIQQKLLQCMSQGMSDKEIAQEMEISQSTVRNHRFKLREKEKQAKLFLAMMGALEEKTGKPIAKSDAGTLEEPHDAATVLDERFGITQEEREKVVSTYMDENGGLRSFPAREKKKLIVLGEIIKNFKSDKDYSEAEVNRILKRIYEEDFPTIRRYLIEYGFMERTRDCRRYRVRE